MGEKKRRILELLSTGAKLASQIADELDDITPYVARTMAEMRQRGHVKNLRPGNGRVALYALTDAGRAALSEGE